MAKSNICKHCKGTGEEPHSHNEIYEGLSCIECGGSCEIIDDHEYINYDKKLSKSRRIRCCMMAKSKEELKEQLEYIEKQVRLCLRESEKAARKAKNYEKQMLERRSVTEYSTVMCIIKHSKDKKRREYDKKVE